MHPSTTGLAGRPKGDFAMTLLTSPVLTRTAIPLNGILNVVRRTARAIIDVLAAALSAPPWRGDVADLYPGNSHADGDGQSHIERLCSYETSRFI
jgi:hypothetical protein